MNEKNSKKFSSRIIYYTKNEDSLEALLCMRCRVSHPIKNAIASLYKKHSAIYEIDYLDMMSYVLDDYGETYLRDFNNKCDECKKEDESVSQNLILTGFKLCKSCRTSKTIFPV